MTLQLCAGVRWQVPARDGLSIRSAPSAKTADHSDSTWLAMASDADNYKRQAAERAVELVEPGAVVGLGHGSTALHALHRLAELMGNGELEGILAVPCSRFVEAEAKSLGIPLTTLERHPVIDITIDGADEVSPSLDLIKGGGGALLREKVVAQASRREVIVDPENGLLGPTKVEMEADVE